MLGDGVTASSRGTAMHTAAAKCTVGAVHALALHGADLNCISFVGQTPLHQAVIGRSVWAVVYLLAAGADPNIKDREGKTAAQLGAESKSDAVRVAFARHLTGQNHV